MLTYRASSILIVLSRLASWALNRAWIAMICSCDMSYASAKRSSWPFFLRFIKVRRRYLSSSLSFFSSSSINYLGDKMATGSCLGLRAMWSIILSCSSMICFFTLSYFYSFERTNSSSSPSVVSLLLSISFLPNSCINAFDGYFSMTSLSLSFFVSECLLIWAFFSSQKVSSSSSRSTSLLSNLSESIL